MTIKFNDPVAFLRIRAKAGMSPTSYPNHCIARYDENDRLMGGVLFVDLTGVSVQMHVAAFVPNWIDKEILFLSFDAPFNKMGVMKIFGFVPMHNEVAYQFNLRLGFRVVAKLADVFPHGEGTSGAYIMEMYRDECRFLNMKPPTLHIVPVTQPIMPAPATVN